MYYVNLHDFIVCMLFQSALFKLFELIFLNQILIHSCINNSLEFYILTFLRIYRIFVTYL